MNNDRKSVQSKLTAIHEKFAAKFYKTHPPQIFKTGEIVWCMVDRKPGDPYTKLDRLWEGPFEVMQRLGSGRYLISKQIRKGGKVRELQADSYRLKPYIPHLDGQEAPLHYYTDTEYLVESDRYIIDDIIRHATFGSGRNKHTKWLVKYRGYPEPEWQSSSAFLHDINDTWTKYNKKHKIDISLSDIRAIWLVPPTYPYILPLPSV